jgi:hypothetical protein
LADLVLFAGPAIADARFNSIPWTRPTSVVVVPCLGADCATVAPRGTDGRILPALVQKVTGKPIESWDRILLAAFSAGGRLLNEIAQVPADLERVVGLTLHDATFGEVLPGLRAAAGQALLGKKLFVATNTNNSSPITSLTARQSIERLVLGAQADTGVALQVLSARPPMPAPSGGVSGAGALAWYDYVKPGAASNTGNDLEHVDHNYLAAKVWEAYAVSALAGSLPSSSGGWQTTVGVGMVALAVWLYFHSRRIQ